MSVRPPLLTLPQMEIVNREILESLRAINDHPLVDLPNSSKPQKQFKFLLDYIRENRKNLGPALLRSVAWNKEGAKKIFKSMGVTFFDVRIKAALDLAKQKALPAPLVRRSAITVYKASHSPRLAKLETVVESPRNPAKAAAVAAKTLCEVKGSLPAVSHPPKKVTGVKITPIAKTAAKTRYTSMKS